MTEQAPIPTAALQGLDRGAIEAARAQFGWNELPRARRVPAWLVFLRQFTGLLVLILVGAAVIALAVGETVDAITIGLVITLNGVLGFVQEWRAESALEALRSMMAPTATVRRDGAERTIPAREIVPGDVVILEAGDSVPADLDLLSIVNLQIDESVLTGESVPVEKVLGAEPAHAFTGTAVVSGRGEGVVSAIGAETEFGQIAGLTGSVGMKRTHLQVQLGRLARNLGIAAVLLAALVLALGLASGGAPLEMFMTGLSLAVAMVPEGLPAVVTITLALGASAMVRQNALARRLQAVETLGAASVICTDKTGTLTENKMTATRIWTSDAIYEVTGTGYDPTGHIARDGARVRATDDPVLGALLTTALTCTHASLRREGHDWVMTGAPTEGALVTLAYKGWAEAPSQDAHEAELPFSSERKRMTVLVRTEAGERLFTKGAPEKVLEICTTLATGSGEVELAEALREDIRSAYAEMAGAGLRVIGLASRPAGDAGLVEESMSFLGLVGLIDPPRVEVAAAIRGARAAGIRVVMITGDSPLTAAAIANQLGLGAPRCITGDQLEELSDTDLHDALSDNVLFARTMPIHKMRIVETLQDMGHVAAMTGDGVNDAPALKRADIGVAMGIRGTDVSKDAADLVLLDDNFATIVRAIGEGRRQFDNVRKFVRYLLSSNAGEVIAIVANLMLGGPIIFYATQILWMNLVTDGVTAVALGAERAEEGQMRRPPRHRDEPVLGLSGLWMILTFGSYTGTASLWLFYSLQHLGEDIARTTAFTGLVVFEKISVFAFRSHDQPCSRIGWFSNPLLLAALSATLAAQLAAVYWPPMQKLLRTVPLGAEQWLLIGALALPLLVVPEAIKMLRSK
ncbi:cation-translocating P-type ATPase [Halovulum sp. GXIMD14794]